MSVLKELNDILFFTILGVIISCIFDIFRALRKIRKRNSIYVVMLQDIIFFVLCTVVSVCYIISILEDNIRLYMFGAMFLGIVLSRKLISRYLIKFYSIIFYSIKSIVIFLCVPIELNFRLICKIIDKLVKKCCKLFSHMINLKCRLIYFFDKIVNLRRGWINEKKSSRGKEKSRKEEEKAS